MAVLFISPHVRAYRAMTNLLVLEFPFRRFRYQEHKSITQKEPSYRVIQIPECVGMLSLTFTSSTASKVYIVTLA